MRTVLITGASRGIGRATATEFLRRGYDVVATARRPETLQGLDGVRPARLDVTDTASIRQAVELAGDVDVLVSNAGNIFHSAVEAIPVDELVRLFDQNTAGALRIAQAVLPGMRARGAGRLLFLSSVVGRIVLPANSAYASTKWALEALVEALDLEVRPLGIQSTLVEPGPVSSGALDDVTRYALPDDPYADLLSSRGSDWTMDTPEVIASAIADAAELPDAPLRLPVGEFSTKALNARKAAREDVAFEL